MHYSTYNKLGMFAIKVIFIMSILEQLRYIITWYRFNVHICLNLVLNYAYDYIYILLRLRYFEIQVETDVF